MIQKLIFNSLIFIAFNYSFAQKQDAPWKLLDQNLNPDSLRADSIKKITAFPEFFRPYVQELGCQKSCLDQVVRVRRVSGDFFVREFLTAGSPIMFGTQISIDTLLLSDSILKNMGSFIGNEGYFGFTNNRLRLVEETWYNQRGGITDRTLISADGKAILFYTSRDYLSPWEDDSKLYYYYEDVLVAVRVSDLVLTSEAELSQFANMKSLPEIVVMALEVEEYIKKRETK